MDCGGRFSVTSLKRAWNILGMPSCQRKRVPEKANRGGISCRSGGSIQLGGFLGRQSRGPGWVEGTFTLGVGAGEGGWGQLAWGPGLSHSELQTSPDVFSASWLLRKPDLGGPALRSERGSCPEISDVGAPCQHCNHWAVNCDHCFLSKKRLPANWALHAH